MRPRAKLRVVPTAITVVLAPPPPLSGTPGIRRAMCAMVELKERGNKRGDRRQPVRHFDVRNLWASGGPAGRSVARNGEAA